MKWDVFISHASEDKDAVARPLREALLSAGLRVWLDVLELTVGDSLRQRIDYGLANSRYGVVILSKAFFAKHWPMSELDGLASRESLGRKVILPVWHRVTYSDVARRSPLLAAKVAANTSAGISQAAAALLKAILPAPGYIAKALEPEDSEWSVKSIDSISVWVGSRQSGHASLCFRKVNRRNEVDLVDFLSLTESYWPGVFELAGCLLGCDSRAIEFSRPTKSYVKARSERLGRVYVNADLFGPKSAISEWREIGSYLHFRNWISTRDVDRDRIDLFLMPYAKNSDKYQPVTRNEGVRRRIVKLLPSLSDSLQRLVRLRLLANEVSVDLTEPVWSKEGVPESGSDSYEIAGNVIWGTRPNTPREPTAEKRGG